MFSSKLQFARSTNINRSYYLKPDVTNADKFGAQNYWCGRSFSKRSFFLSITLPLKIVNAFLQQITSTINWKFSESSTSLFGYKEIEHDYAISWEGNEKLMRLPRIRFSLLSSISLFYSIPLKSLNKFLRKFKKIQKAVSVQSLFDGKFVQKTEFLSSDTPQHTISWYRKHFSLTHARYTPHFLWTQE